MLLAIIMITNKLKSDHYVKIAYFGNDCYIYIFSNHNRNYLKLKYNKPFNSIEFVFIIINFVTHLDLKIVKK